MIDMTNFIAQCEKRGLDWKKLWDGAELSDAAINKLMGELK